jgi:small ubiquitin-related modifier
MSESNDQHEAQATNDVKPKAEEGEGDGTLSIRVRDQHGGEVVFKVKRTTKMKRVLQAFCDRKGWNPTEVRFTFDGLRVNDDMSPEDLGMESNDSIDAFLEQMGGRM